VQGSSARSASCYTASARGVSSESGRLSSGARCSVCSYRAISSTRSRTWLGKEERTREQPRFRATSCGRSRLADRCQTTLRPISRPGRGAFWPSSRCLCARGPISRSWGVVVCLASSPPRWPGVGGTARTEGRGRGVRADRCGGPEGGRRRDPLPPAGCRGCGGLLGGSGGLVRPGSVGGRLTLGRGPHPSCVSAVWTLPDIHGLYRQLEYRFHAQNQRVCSRGPDSVRTMKTKVKCGRGDWRRTRSGGPATTRPPGLSIGRSRRPEGLCRTYGQPI
jgi:hypothetical protein